MIYISTSAFTILLVINYYSIIPALSALSYTTIFAIFMTFYTVSRYIIIILMGIAYTGASLQCSITYTLNTAITTVLTIIARKITYFKIKF